MTPKEADQNFVDANLGAADNLIQGVIDFLQGSDYEELELIDLESALMYLDRVRASYVRHDAYAAEEGNPEDGFNAVLGGQWWKFWA